MHTRTLNNTECVCVGGGQAFCQVQCIALNWLFQVQTIKVIEPSQHLSGILIDTSYIHPLLLVHGGTQVDPRWSF